MRLLSRNDGVLKLTTFEHPPSYAILSHTWGKDEDEVTFQDIFNGTYDKAGYKKLDFCLTQARKDGYCYVWIDTCCINKDSQTELGEAINRMFQWYQEAAVCYVYLADVSHDGGGLLNSRWFTRGWTLQELVAPQEVMFYSSDGELLGDRTALRGQVLAATGIDTLVPLRDVSLAERFRWSLNRQTKKPEDMSYCLLGILGVKLLFNYGEDADRARERLFKEIEEEHGRKGKAVRNLHLSWVAKEHGSAGDMTTPGRLLDSLCFENMGVRRATINDPMSHTCTWLLNHEDYKTWSTMTGKRFLWLKGKPGAGKSTLVKYADSKATCLRISFYFNARGELLEQSTTGMYRTLLYQLLQKLPSMQQVVIEYIQELGTKWSWSLFVLRHAFRLVADKLDQPVQCFVDALDECNTGDIQEMVDFLQDLTCSYLFVFFASRHYPAVTIRHSQELVLERHHSADVEHYVNERLSVGSLQHDELSFQIVKKADGVFLLAVLLVREMNKAFIEGNVYCMQQKLTELPATLANMFEKIVLQETDDSERFCSCIQWVLFSRVPMGGEMLYYAIAYTLGNVSLQYLGERSRTLTFDDLARFVTAASRGLVELRRLEPYKNVMRVQFIHESVREFFLRSDMLREITPNTSVDNEAWIHNRLAHVCLQAWSSLGAEAGKHTSSANHSRAARQQDRAYEAWQLRHDKAFMFYAAGGMVYHAERATNDDDQDVLVRSLHEIEWPHFLASPDYLRPRWERTSIHSPIHLFSECNGTRLINAAHRLGFNVDVCDNEGTTPLHHAIQSSCDSAAVALINCGADLTVKRRRDGFAALQILLSRYHLASSDSALLELMLQKGAANNTTEHDCSTIELVDHESPPLVWKLLLQYGADSITHTDRQYVMGVFQNACRAQQLDLVIILAQYGYAALQTASEDWPRFLLRVCCDNDLETLRFLLAQDLVTSASVVDGGRSLLTIACCRDESDMLQLFLDAYGGQLVHRTLENGMSPLAMACWNLRIRPATLLLEYGADAVSTLAWFESANMRLCKNILERLLSNIESRGREISP